MAAFPSRRTTWQLALALTCAFGAGVWAATFRETPVVVVTEPIEEQPVTEMPRSRTVGAGIALPGSTDAAVTDEPACEGMQPGPSWNCIDGKWQVGPPPTPQASGGGRIDRAGGCLTEQPGSAFVCDSGLWVLNGTAGMGNGSATASSGGRRDDSCLPPAPAGDWTCENGVWTPPPPVEPVVLPSTALPSTAPPTPSTDSQAPTATDAPAAAPMSPSEVPAGE